MTDLLKGNFSVQNPVKEEDKTVPKTGRQLLEEKFEKAALNSIGGSMVYVKRSKLTWNGDEGDGE